jgi:hypothetical protein
MKALVMKKLRPTAVVVIAILELVGGGLGLAQGLCGLALASGGGSQMFTGLGGQQGKVQQDLPQRMEKEFAAKVPGYQVAKYGALAVAILLSILMLIAGAGLLAMKPWARSLSIVYALLSIANHIFSLVYAFAFTIPAANEFFREAAADKEVAQFASLMQAMLPVSTIVAAVFVAFPITVLIVMLLPSVAAAFRGKGMPEEPPDYYDERPDERFQAEDR